METNFKEQQIPKVEQEGLSLKDLKLKVLRNWYWFAIFSFIGLVVSFVYHQFVPTKYGISSTLLIKNDSRSTEMNNIFRQLNVNQGNPAIQDQVGVLMSYNLNLRAMQNFDWRYSWYKKDWFSKKDLYMNFPFSIEEPDESVQIENVELKVIPKSETEYRLSCDKKIKINGVEVRINFDEIVPFGELFKNSYFQFTINKIADRPIPVGEEFVLEFNNVSQLAIAYKNKLEVKPGNEVENSNLLILEMETSNLQRDVDYLNQLGKIYIQFGLDEKNRIANSTIKFIDDQITGVDRSLQIAGDQFSDFRSRNRTVDLGQEATTVVDKLKQIEAERADIDLTLDYYNNLKFYLENRDQNKDLVAPSLGGNTDEALNQKVLRLNELYVKREVLSYTAQERNPVLISLTNEINYTQKSLKENVENLISNAKVELENLNHRQRSINAELSKLPKTEQDLIGIKRNFDLNNELYTFLLQRRAEAEISKASNNPDAQILDPAEVEIAVVLGPILLINLAAGLFGGMFIALSLVIIKEMSSDVLTDVEEISKRLDVSVLGSIGSNKFKTEMAAYQYPRSALTESFRGLRLNLEHLFREHDGNVLAIHSYISGEGKSFVAFNLAIIFAKSNRKVLLVDGDLRRPRLHKILKQDHENGLSGFLDGSKDLSEIVRKTNIDNLDFVSSGDAHFDSSELLNNGRIKTFIDLVKNQYDYVIIDNSPVGIVFDPVLIGVHADINLILLRLNYSKREELSAINKIGFDGVLKNVTVAVNDIKQSFGFGYYTEENPSMDGPEPSDEGSIVEEKTSIEQPV